MLTNKLSFGEPMFGVGLAVIPAAQVDVSTSRTRVAERFNKLDCSLNLRHPIRTSFPEGSVSISSSHGRLPSSCS